ncbi:hypothetical protein JCM24511_07306 [Saitozyma sp. JCM 24511]|nr:hypothetical protein JCM24511_07306 [Saitozyma sp. JCM 24511]
MPNYLPDSQLQDCETWAREDSAYHIEADLQLACSLSHHIVPQLAKVTSALPVSQQIYELDRLDSVMEKHLQHWFSVESPSGLSQVARVVLKGWALEGAFRVKQVRFERFPSDETRADAIFAAISFIEQMKLVATSGYLRFISDDAAIVLSRAGLFFSKIFNDVPSTLKALIVQSMTMVHSFCTESSRGDPELTAAFVARFFGGLLSTLKAESRAQSPAAVIAEATSIPIASSEGHTQAEDFNFDLVSLPNSCLIVRQSKVPDMARMVSSKVMQSQAWTTLNH